MAGTDLTFFRYSYSVNGVDVTLWADEGGKLHLQDVPSQHAALVRDGYDTIEWLTLLRPANATTPWQRTWDTMLD